MTIHDSIKLVSKELERIYDPDESLNLATWLTEYVTGFDKLLLAQSKRISISTANEEKIRQLLNRLLNHEPIQYVLEEAWFFGMRFFVNKNVLIPRPETEELVDLVIRDGKKIPGAIRILDIGTGSGCIPVSLKKHLPTASVWSIDVSEPALEVARINAATKNIDINFIQDNFLDRELQSGLPDFDIIVSNPPYVAEKEKGSMRQNVLSYEPHEALFVPDEDPLIFYREIAEFARTHLRPNGKIYCEINENLGEETRKIFEDLGYDVEIIKDMQGKDRIIKCYRGY